MVITRAQRQAIKRVYDRNRYFGDKSKHNAQGTYREFRKLVQPTFGCDGAVVLPWCGMWLCIERDGYTHS